MVLHDMFKPSVLSMKGPAHMVTIPNVTTARRTPELRSRSKNSMLLVTLGTKRKPKNRNAADMSAVIAAAAGIVTAVVPNGMNEYVQIVAQAGGPTPRPSLVATAEQQSWRKKWHASKHKSAILVVNVLPPHCLRRRPGPQQLIPHRPQEPLPAKPPKFSSSGTKRSLRSPLSQLAPKPFETTR